MDAMNRRIAIATAMLALACAPEDAPSEATPAPPAETAPETPPDTSEVTPARGDMSTPPELAEPCWGWQATDAADDGFFETGRLQLRHPVTWVVLYDETTEQSAEDDSLSEYTWDDAGITLLEERHTHSGLWWTYTYTYGPTGALVLLTARAGDPEVVSGSTTYTYDDAGRLTESVEVAGDGSHERTSRWFYDDTGRLVATESVYLDFPMSRQEFAYDAEGRLVAISGPDGLPTIAYTWPEPDLRISEHWTDCDDGSRGVGAVYSLRYDAAGHPLSEVGEWTEPGESQWGYACGPHDATHLVTWTWDGDLLLDYAFAQEDRSAFPSALDYSYAMTYDALGNLVEGYGWLGAADFTGRSVWTWSCPGGSGLGTEPLARLLPR